MKSVFPKVLFFSLALGLVSCQNPKKPNYQFFPNMYESVGYETLAESESFNGPNQLHGQTAQIPPDGTIKRGFEVYEFEDTPAGYLLAKANAKSPIESFSEKDISTGKELYNIYCAICHGENGNGVGKLVEREKILGVPSYADREITDGSIYHVLTYGLNSMGAYKNQLSQHERWLVTEYVQQLKKNL